MNVDRLAPLAGLKAGPGALVCCFWNSFVSTCRERERELHLSAPSRQGTAALASPLLHSVGRGAAWRARRCTCRFLYRHSHASETVSRGRRGRRSLIPVGEGFLIGDGIRGVSSGGLLVWMDRRPGR